MPAQAPNLQLVPPPRMTFREVYDAEFDFVWRVLRRLGLNEQAAEDGTQDVFLRFHANFGSWDQQRPVRALLAGYAWNVGSEMRRRASARYELPAGDTLPDAGHAGHERMDGRIDAVRMIEHALGALTDDQRDVVVLHVLEERPMPEVAEILGEKGDTLSSRLRAARKIFLPRLERLKRGSS